MAEVATIRSTMLDTVSSIPGLVWAFRLHGDGSAEALALDKPIDFTHDGRLWLHFNLTDARARPWIQQSGLPPLARELLLSNDTFQQLHVIDGCVTGCFPIWCAISNVRRKKPRSCALRWPNGCW